MASLNLESSGIWAAPVFVYASFCFWMIFACIYHEDDRYERLSWSISLIFFGIFSAPYYYWKHYRPYRAQQKKVEAAAAEELRSLIGPRK